MDIMTEMPAVWNTTMFIFVSAAKVSHVDLPTKRFGRFFRLQSFF